MTVTDRSGLGPFEEDGFAVVRGLFTPAEIDELCAEFAALHAAGPVPGHFELFCPQEADPALSFAREYVPPPSDLATVPVDMEPGDVLFFNGSLVHGSGPNRSADRFRRSFIGHYVGRSTRRIGGFYGTLTMDGAPVALPESEGAGPCGTDFPAAGPH
ncbi:phytanoyl-CoA dioxygenase family protein [Streptomyces sp. NPDC002685]|uniref:phytanoyl-CoA dioxygenase family protein n=1 Tax=Streptomyces sp. NPDC002685 TaxID=3154540 RepID=UPI00331A5B2A